MAYYNSCMPHLLLTLEANKLMNKSVFTHKLHIFDNKIIYEARTYLIRVTEITISYNHVSQVYLVKGIYFASLEIINTGGVKDIIIKYVPAKQAEKAKRIIDAKIHGVSDESYTNPKNKEVVTLKKRGQDIHLDNVENNLSRLNELLLRKRITKKEFEQKRKEVLKHMK